MSFILNSKNKLRFKKVKKKKRPCINARKSESEQLLAYSKICGSWPKLLLIITV